MKRREFIALLGGAVAGWPLVARAQQPSMPVVGFLNSQSPETFPGPLRGFRQGLKEAGFIESENLAIEYRWANNDQERLSALAAGSRSSYQPAALRWRVSSRLRPRRFPSFSPPATTRLELVWSRALPDRRVI